MISVTMMQSTGTPLTGTASEKARSAASEPLPDLLPPTEVGGGGPVSMAEIAELMCRSAREDQTEARSMAAHEERLIVEEGKQQVAAMREKAADIREEAYTSGLCELAAGTLKFAAAGYGSPEHSKDGYKGKQLVAQGEMCDAMGKIKAAPYKAAQAEDDAAAEEHRIAASAAERRVDVWRDEAREARDLVKSVLDAVKSATETRSNTRNAAVWRA